MSGPRSASGPPWVSRSAPGTRPAPHRDHPATRDRPRAPDARGRAGSPRTRPSRLPAVSDGSIGERDGTCDVPARPGSRPDIARRLRPAFAAPPSWGAGAGARFEPVTTGRLVDPGTRVAGVDRGRAGAVFHICFL